MITVRVTGLVIPSANNIVNYVVFILSRLFKGVYIFSNKILPLIIKLMRVYIVGIIF